MVESIPLGEGDGTVWLGYSLPAMEKDLRDQTSRWMNLEMEAGAAALLAGLLVNRSWAGKWRRP